MHVPKPRKLPSGRWFIQLRLGGKSICITDPDRRSCVNRATVVKAAYKLEKGSLAVAEQSRPTGCTLTALIDRYIESKSNVLSPSTIRGYRAIQKGRFQTVMQRKPEEIKPEEWQQIVNREASLCSPKTLKNAFAFLRTVIQTETRIELPAVQLSQAVRSNTAFLAPEEIKKFIAVIKEDQEFAVPALLALSSLRMSEIAALRWEDIPEKPEFIRVRGSVVKDENNCYVNKKQNKNISSARNVPILIPELQEVIARDRKPRGPVLKGQNCFRRAIHRACCAAGVTDVTVHGLRHSFATLAYHLRIPEKITMEIGGWADSGTMNRIYTHIAKSDFDRYRDMFGEFYRTR